MRKFLYYVLWILIASWWVPLFLPAKFINKKRKFEKHSIILSNHVSVLDPIIYVGKFPQRPLLFAKKELKNSPLKLIAKIFNIVFVDRGNADISAVKAALGELNKNGRLLLFPEGTRNKLDNEEMLEIKNGAALFSIRCKAPITLTMVHHRQRLFCKNYLYMGETFELSEFYGQKPTQEILSIAGEIISKKMSNARAQMEELMRQKYGKKRWYIKHQQRIAQLAEQATSPTSQSEESELAE